MTREEETKKFTELNVTKTSFGIQGIISYEAQNLKDVMLQLTRATEEIAGSAVSIAFLEAIRKTTKKINAEILNAFFKQDDVKEAFRSGAGLNAALGLGAAFSAKDELRNFVAKSLLTGTAAKAGQLRDVVGTASNQLTRNVFFGFQKGITSSDFAQQSFGSYQSVSRGRGRAGSQVLSAGRTNTVNWLEFLVSPDRGRVPGFRIIRGKPTDPEMSGSRTGYAIMRFGGSFTIKPFFTDPTASKIGIVEALFYNNEELFTKIRDEIFGPVFQDELNKAIVKLEKQIRGRGRAATSLSTAGGGTIDIGTGGVGGRTTASLRGGFDDGDVQGTGEGTVKFSKGVQRRLNELSAIDPFLTETFTSELSTNLNTSDVIAQIDLILASKDQFGSG